jgi:hypothetical protein
MKPFTRTGITQRNALTRAHLNAFTRFMIGRGHAPLPSPITAKYELTRFDMNEREGSNPPVIIFFKDRSEQLTVSENGLELVRDFFEARAKVLHT